jgi:hypothetical protein
MVEDGPDCCRSSVRRVHKGGRVCSGRRALVQFLKVAKARLKTAFSSAAREEGPRTIFKISLLFYYPIYIIIYTASCIIQIVFWRKVWINMPNLLNKFRLYFQNKSFDIFRQTKFPTKQYRKNRGSVKKYACKYATQPRPPPGRIAPESSRTRVYCGLDQIR